MIKKKLILYCISIFLAIIILIYVVIFAKRLLKTEANNRGESEANLVTDTKDVDTIPDLEDTFEVDYSQDVEDTYENDDQLDNSIAIPKGEIQPDDINDNIPKDDPVDNLDSLDDEIKDVNNITVPEPLDDTEDPQQVSSEGIVIDVREIEKPKNETDDITYGIDVAKWQGVIDWAKVGESGVEFAMIRIGYRTQVDGKITEDPYAKYNLQQAQKHGIKLGIYFFSTAINKEEAEEEAKWVVKFIAPHKITYPVVYNCEGFSDLNNRQYNMTKDERTGLAIVFLDYIKEKGYTPMFYAAKNELENSSDWGTDTLTKKYKIWVAQYPDAIGHNSKSSYSGSHEMWQYTSKGKVPGIKGTVDLNIAYFGYKKEADAKDETQLKEVIADPVALINFKEVKETVTAKEVTNLRDVPGVDNESKVVAVLSYGDTATRTGIGDNGWSRVEYKGKTLYAVTSYLTTDLNYKDTSKPTIENPEAGIAFTKVNERVTSKIVTNLRLVPNSESDDTIVTSLENGEIAIRTGIGSNGWSRVEYDGQILYAVTNYLEVVQDEN